MTVDQRCLGIKLLRSTHRLNHGLDFAFQVVTLIDHEGDIGSHACFPFLDEELVEYAKYLIGINRAQS